MKKAFISGILLAWVFVLIGLGQEIKIGSPEFGKALRDGAMAKFTLKIVDVDGVAVTNASVMAHFEMEGHQGIKGISDTNGLFSMEDKSRGQMHYGVSKEGYYSTSSTMSFGRQEGIVIKDGKWQPWNPVITVVLKNIKNPVTMYAHHGEYEIPAKKVSLAFDLEKRDWVVPYGKGVQQDMLVYLEENIPDPNTWSKKLLLSFGTNFADGVKLVSKEVFSTFVSPYAAPDVGYGRSVSWEFDRTANKILTDKRSSASDCLIYRVRTELDDKGNIVKANYGKVYGPVEFGLIGPKSVLKMTYYFNPEVNSKNLEFDPKKNLFKHLSSLEEVQQP